MHEFELISTGIMTYRTEQAVFRSSYEADGRSTDPAVPGRQACCVCKTLTCEGCEQVEEVGVVVHGDRLQLLENLVC